MSSDVRESDFKSCFANGHLQTIWNAVAGKYILKKSANFSFTRERLETPDYDFLDIDWVINKKNQINKPLLVLFHGLEGSSESQYSIAFARVAIENNWSFVVVNFRGCSGEVNLAPRAYHAGDSDEINWVLEKINSLAVNKIIFCVGISLGGNALLKWISKHDRSLYSSISKVKGIVTISAPIDLIASGKKLDSGINRLIYSKFFLKTMICKAKKKWEQYPGLFNLDAVVHANTIEEFDNLFTAPLHKFVDVRDYWKKSSSINDIKFITTPTLIINAQNDPLIPNFSLDYLNISNSRVEFCNPTYGGHVGFSSKGKLKNFEDQFLEMPRLVINWFIEKFKIL